MAHHLVLRDAQHMCNCGLVLGRCLQQHRMLTNRVAICIVTDTQWHCYVRSSMQLWVTSLHIAHIKSDQARPDQTTTAAAALAKTVKQNICNMR